MIQLSAEEAKTRPDNLRSIMAASDAHTGGCLGCPLAKPRSGLPLSLRFLGSLLLDLYCYTNARRHRRRRSIHEMELRVYWPADSGGMTWAASQVTSCECQSRILRSSRFSN